MQGLADELGVSRVTLFRRVGSREELLSQALWRLTERMLDSPSRAGRRERPEGGAAHPRHHPAHQRDGPQSRGLRRLLDDEPALPCACSPTRAAGCRAAS